MPPFQRWRDACISLVAVALISYILYGHLSSGVATLPRGHGNYSIESEPLFYFLIVGVESFGLICTVLEALYIEKNKNAK